MLDPRFKDRIVLNDSKIFREKVRVWLCDELQTEIAVEANPEIDCLSSSPAHSPPAKRTASFFEQLDKIAEEMPKESMLAFV